jgi:translation initiation factor 2 subunit 2
MDFYDYENMLEEAMSKIPKKSNQTSRFKVPEVKHEIQGNKTIIHNFSEITDAIRRDSKHLSKYLCKEVALACSIKGNQLILYGNVRKEDLQRKIESYINEFVFCKSCKNPDTKIVTEGRINYLICEACGAKSSVRNL